MLVAVEGGGRSQATPVSWQTGKQATKAAAIEGADRAETMLLERQPSASEDDGEAGHLVTPCEVEVDEGGGW